MPDIWLDVDTALSEVPVNLMPLIDDTTFKDIEDAVAYNASGMALRWHFVTTGGAYTVTSVTPTTGGTYDWTDQGDSGIYTIEIPASGGASINNDTEGFGWFTGKATGVLPWRGPVIGFRAAALNNLLIDDALSTTRGLAGTALPNAAADAAGGLVISDAGGFDIDNRAASATSVGNMNVVFNTDFATNYNTTRDKWNVNLVDIAGATLDAMSAQIGVNVAAMANNVIDSSKVADNTITAAKINADAFTAAKFASDVTTEFQSGLATAAELAKVPKSDSNVTWNATALASIQAEANDAIVANNLDHLVLLAVDTDFATTVHLNSVIGHLADAGTSATFDRTTDALEVLGAATAPSAASIADAVWTEAVADHSGVSGSTAEALAAAGGAGDPWITALPGSYSAGQAGYILGTNLNAAITSRMATYTQPTGFLAATFPTTVASTTNITAASGVTISGTTTTLDALQTAQNSAHGAGSWATATGFSTHSAADVADAVWDEATTSHTTSGTFGEQLKTDVDTLVSRLTSSRAGYLDNLSAGAVAQQTTLQTLANDNVSNFSTTINSLATLLVYCEPTATSLGTDIANVATAIADVPTVSEFNARTLAAADYFDPAADTVANVTLVGTLTTYTGNTPQTGDAYAAVTSAVPDSVPADGSRPSVQQAVYMIVQALTEGGISGTTWTIKKPDGSTTLFTVTLDDANTPTSKTRAS